MLLAVATRKGGLMTSDLYYRFLGVVILVAALAIRATAANPGGNEWLRLEKAEIVGKRWDVPLGHDPGAKHFVILGGRTNFADYKKPRSYDVLALDEAEARWENVYPLGK